MIVNTDEEHAALRQYIGQRLHVTFEDCCVSGSMIAVLVDIDEQNGLRFDNGVQLRGYKIQITPTVT